MTESSSSDEHLPGFTRQQWIPSIILDADLRRMNPWWEGKPQRVLPATRRHLVSQMRRRLNLGLAPIVVVRGPRQIGKTTSQLQLIDDLLKEGVSPKRVLRAQFDDLDSLQGVDQSILRIVGWFEHVVLRRTLNESAAANERAYLFLDEVQNITGWAEQLKSLVDHASVHVVVTGSSALRIERGRDSLAGRITTIDAGVLSLTEIAEFRALGPAKPFLKDNGLEPLNEVEFWRSLAQHGRTLHAIRDPAFAAFSSRGGYPLSHEKADVPWAMIADQLNETVVKRVIQHDLRIGERGRKRDPRLLEELFRLGCRYAGQSPHYSKLAEELRRGLGANVGLQRVSHYMDFLNDSLLLRLVQPAEIRLKRSRGSPKICLADHALRASWLHEVIPLDPAELAKNVDSAPLAGRIAESVVGACLLTIPGLDVNWLPARNNAEEIDFVLTIGTRRIPIEVKYQRRIQPQEDTSALRRFLETEANNASFGVLVTQQDSPDSPDPRIVVLPLSSFLLIR